MDENNESYNILPEAYKHDCTKCQSLCCVALRIECETNLMTASQQGYFKMP